MKYLTRCYSEYNFLYGIEKVKDIIKMASERGYHAVNIVEKGSMHSLQEIVDLNEKTTLVLIFSVEVTISIVGLKQTILITPRTQCALKKLNLILKIDNLEISDLQVLSNDCLITIIETKHLSLEQYTNIAKQLKNIFNHLYLEYKVDLFHDGQDTINISKELSIPAIPGKINILCSPYNAIHRDVLICIETKTKYHIHPKHNWEEENISILHADSFTYMCKPKGLDQNVKSFLYKCNLRQKKQSVTLDFKSKYNIFTFQKLIKSNLLNLVENKNEHDKFVYLIRTIHEYRTIVELKYPNYFLILYDICEKEKEEGVFIGPGRGSAAGCLISYLFNITDMDPIKYGLYFERFLNKDRVEMPDIDISS